MLNTQARLAIVTLLFVAMAAGANSTPARAAQLVDSRCNADYATPAQPLASAGLGLTQAEMDERYGPGIAAQEYWIYEQDGYDIRLNCSDLEVNIEQESPYADPDAAAELAQTLLPDDAAPQGGWHFGSILNTVTEIELWHSDDLAARYDELENPRTGTILVVYTYIHVTVGDERIIKVQMGALTPDQ